MIFCPEKCDYSWQDDNVDYPTCHYKGPDCLAPCTMEPKGGKKMSFQRLPHTYPIGSTVWIGWRPATVLFHIGKLHLIWFNDPGLSF